MQRGTVIPYRRFVTTYRSQLQESSSPSGHVGRFGLHDPWIWGKWGFPKRRYWITLLLVGFVTSQKRTNFIYFAAEASNHSSYCICLCFYIKIILTIRKIKWQSVKKGCRRNRPCPNLRYCSCVCVCVCVCMCVSGGTRILHKTQTGQ